MTTTTHGPATLDELTGTWDLDPAHTRLGFSARHAMVTTVRGHFRDVTGTLVLDGATPTASAARVAVRAESIDTGNADRDAHLRSADFLDAEGHPELTFVSTSVVHGRGEGSYRMRGDLTIRGVTREVELELGHDGTTTDPWGNLRAGFSGGTTISRKEWGLTWNVALEAGGILVGDKVTISLDVSAVKRG